MPRPLTPAFAADIVIELCDRDGRPLVLIERKSPPFGWALPGGFVDVGETVEQAAVREAREETGLKIDLHCLLGLYSDPRRDARGHTVSAVFVAQARGTPVASDDAANVRIIPIDAIPRALAFDHAQILDDYLHYRATGKVAPLRLNLSTARRPD